MQNAAALASSGRFGFRIAPISCRQNFVASEFSKGPTTKRRKVDEEKEALERAQANDAHRAGTSETEWRRQLLAITEKYQKLAKAREREANTENLKIWEATVEFCNKPHNRIAVGNELVHLLNEETIRLFEK